MNLIKGDMIMCGLPEPEVLKLNTVLYYGFGGYTVRKNGIVFYQGDSDEDWNNFKKLKDIEKEALKDPDADWEVELYEPLSGATWKRDKIKKMWVVTGRNTGFA